MRTDTPPPMEGSDDEEALGIGDEDIEIVENFDFEVEGEYSGDDDGVNDDDDFEGSGAAAGPAKDDADLIFSMHTGSVFCCAIDSSNTNAVSGGEDDRAFVWSLETGEVLFECTGHKDSVICVCWNHDGTLVATGDMSGIIKVWQVQTKSVIWEFETSDLRWLEWHHRANILLAGTSDGDGWMWRIPEGDCKTFPSYGHPVSCGAVLPDGKRAVLGYENGHIRLWDLKTASVLHAVTDATAHEESVTSIDSQLDGALVATGSVDGTAKIMNTNSGKIVATLNCMSLTPEEESSNSVESVAFCPSQPLVAAGTLKGELSIWDVPTQIQRHLCKQESGIVKIRWDPTSPLVYAASLDGCVRVWDGRSGRMEGQWFGHESDVLDIDLSRDGATLLTSGEDKTCRVFKLQNIKV